MRKREHIVQHAHTGIDDGGPLDATNVRGLPTIIGSTGPAGSVVAGTYRLAKGGGEETADPHGSLGSTETIDLVDGNYHSGTLTANCTFTFTGATPGVLCDFILKLTQDGTGGWTSTFPASVVDGAALASSLDTTLSTTSLLVFVTDDGGTTWYGYLAGAASGGASYGTPANTYGTPAAGAASTGVRTDATLPGPPIVILTLTNKSGGSVAAGDVVVIDTGNDTAFTTTTTGQAEVSVGIAQATIANNASGAVLVAGLAALVNVPSSMTRGRYLETHTVVKQATGSATRRAGSFGQFLIAGTTPTAWLWGQTDQTASGGSLTDHTHAVTGSGSTGGGASLAPTTLILPQGTTPAQTAEGSAVWDTDDDKLTIGTGAARKTMVNEGAATASGLTMATARLLGRNTASTGAIEEITLGTNLSYSGTTLNASGGSGLTVQYPALKPGTPTYDFGSSSLDGAFSAHSSGGSFATTSCQTQGAGPWPGSTLDMQFSGEMGRLTVTHANTDLDATWGGVVLEIGEQANLVATGIMALNSSGNGIGVMQEAGDIYFGKVVAYQFTTVLASWGTGKGPATASYVQSGAMWYRIKRVSGTWTGYASLSGRTWDKVFATDATAYTIDRIGIGLFYNTAVTYFGHVRSDYLQVDV